MISLDEAVLAKYQREGLVFEIYVDPELAREIKSGKEIPVVEVVAAEEIFSDASAGKRASDEDLNKAFGSNNFEEVALIIINKGEIQLTTEQRRKIQEKKKRQLVELISRGAVDPKTHVPHPSSRIEKILDEAKFHVDVFKTAESQLEDALKVLKPIIPIKMETVRMAIKVPAEHSGKVAGVMKSYKKVKEQWGSDGSFMVLIEIPAGLQGDLMDKLNKMTQGNVDSKVVERLWKRL